MAPQAKFRSAQTPPSPSKPAVQKEDDYGIFNFLKSDPSMAASPPPVATKEDNNIKSLFNKKDEPKPEMVKQQKNKVAPVKVETKTPLAAKVKAPVASTTAVPAPRGTATN